MYWKLTVVLKTSPSTILTKTDLHSALSGGLFPCVHYIDSSMSNVNYNAVLFTNTSENERAPQFTGYVTVPTSRIDELISLLQSRKVFQDQGVDTVRRPLSFWKAEGKAPLAFKGQSSFQVLEGTPVTQKMSVIVDKTPAV